MRVRTCTEKLHQLRKNTFELILTEHNKNCTACVKNLKCELQNLAAYFGLNSVSLPYIARKHKIFSDEPFFDRDYNLCILCGKCVRVCEEVRKNNAVDFFFRGIETVPAAASDLLSDSFSPLKNSNCEFCGACVDLCPSAALIEKDFTSQIDKTVTTICPYCGVGCSIKLEIKNEFVEYSDFSRDVNGANFNHIVAPISTGGLKKKSLE